MNPVLRNFAAFAVAVALLASSAICARAVGACTSNTDCPDEYCAKTEGDCDGQGSCSPMPSICPDIWDPVCGCDGTTYGNSCEAAMAGVNVAQRGECPAFLCTSNLDCPGEYCAKTEGDCDGQGSCSPMPSICPDVWDPVCGCDSTTYGNSCEAAMAGVNSSSTGVCDECKSDPQCIFVDGFEDGGLNNWSSTTESVSGRPGRLPA